MSFASKGYDRFELEATLLRARRRPNLSNGLHHQHRFCMSAQLGFEAIFAYITRKLKSDL